MNMEVLGMRMTERNGSSMLTAKKTLSCRREYRNNDLIAPQNAYCGRAEAPQRTGTTLPGAENVMFAPPTSALALGYICILASPVPNVLFAPRFVTVLFTISSCQLAYSCAPSTRCRSQGTRPAVRAVRGS